LLKNRYLKLKKKKGEKDPPRENNKLRLLKDGKKHKKE